MMTEAEIKEALAHHDECTKVFEASGVKPGAVIAVQEHNVLNRHAYRMRVTAARPAGAAKGIAVIEGYRLRKDGSEYARKSHGVVLFLDRLVVELPATCAGSGRRWQPGTGSPMCPVCHYGPRKLSRVLGFEVVARRRRDNQGWHGTVPNHPPRTK